jgi:hypothetical protein
MREQTYCARHRGLGSRPLLDDLRVQELSDELNTKTGIGSSVRGVELELRVGEVEPVGVDHAPWIRRHQVLGAASG